MVVGVGALGSSVARSLVAMGVGRITLVDPDQVTPGNVVRHEARMPDVGRNKTEAMTQVLQEASPYVEVASLAGTRGSRGKFEASLDSRPTLIVATVAMKAVHWQIEEAARAADPPIPVLHAWVMGEAQVLRAFVYRPGQTACVFCIGLYERDQSAGTRDWGFIAGPSSAAQPFFEASCTNPAFPGAGNANALAAHVIVEMALDVLHDRLSVDESHWVFAGNRIRDVDPTYGVQPLTIERRGFEPHPECPMCSGEETRTELTSEEQADYDRTLATARMA